MSWLWVQEKEASRVLQYLKVRGSDNSADLFTKALEHDSVRRHTEAMGCEFMFGRDPIAFTAHNHNMSANVIMAKVVLEAEEQFKASGRMGRVDTHGLVQQSNKTTNKGGPGKTLHTE